MAPRSGVKTRRGPDLIRKFRERAVDAAELLIGRFRFVLGKPPWPGPIFVLGTGRSGTTWMGRILDSHAEIAASIERRRFFRLSTQMALDPDQGSRGIPRLIRL